MDRRTLISGVGAGLISISSGCIGRLRNSKDRELRVVATPQFSAQAPIELSVSVEETELAEDRYPVIQFGYENRTSETVYLSYGFGLARDEGILGPIRSEPDGLMMFGVDFITVPSDDGYSCVQLPWDPDRAVDNGSVTGVGGNQTTRVELGIVGNRSVLDGDCPDTGEYAFANGVVIVDGDDADEFDELGELHIALEGSS